MSVGQFMMFSLLGLGLLSLFLILLIVLKRNKKEVATPAVATPQGTTIDFKPEFNFGSRNGTDDDVVYPNGIYTMTIPFSVESLDIKATAEDKNAKVAISGQNGLPAEATTDVLIRVTAENGSVKTYTIKVTREKDPNKPKSGNNYLKSLTQILEF